MRALIEHGRLRTCHDISDGGLLVAIAEMALVGGIGAAVETPPDATGPLLQAWLFGEDQGRYLIAVPAADVASIEVEAGRAGVPLRRIGRVGGTELTLDGKHAISLAALRAANESWLPRFMSP